MPEVTKEFNDFLVELAKSNGFEIKNEEIDTSIKAAAFVKALKTGLLSLEREITATKTYDIKPIDSDDYVTSFLTPASIQALKDSQEVTGQFKKKQQEDTEFWENRGKATKEAMAGDLKKEREIK